MVKLGKKLKYWKIEKYATSLIKDSSKTRTF